MTEKIGSEEDIKNGKKRQYLFFNAFFYHFQKRETKSKSIFGKIIPLYIMTMVLKTILHGQMTEKIAFEVRIKKDQKLQNVLF